MTSPTVTESHSVSTCWACLSTLCVHFNCPECGPCRKCVEMFERIACASRGTTRDTQAHDGSAEIKGLTLSEDSEQIVTLRPGQFDTHVRSIWRR
jgi:hypothetical protein